MRDALGLQALSEIPIIGLTHNACMMHDALTEITNTFSSSGEDPNDSQQLYICAWYVHYRSDNFLDALDIRKVMAIAVGALVGSIRGMIDRYVDPTKLCLFKISIPHR